MKILLAIDPSPASEAALSAILARPHPAGTSVTALSIIAPIYLHGDPAIVKELELRENWLVQRAAERVRAAGLAATPLVMRGNPKEVIVDYAANTQADFVFVGAHGETALPEFLLGSVARAVVRFAPCPVAVIRTSSGTRPPGNGLKILLATDGSDDSKLAAHSIADRPWLGGTEVRILSVATAMLPPAEMIPYDAATKASLEVESLEWTESSARDAKAILAGHDLTISVQDPPLFGSPKNVIVTEAGRWPADLIVVGSHGLSGIRRHLIGSVSEAVAMHAKCSVEVIRAKART